MSLKNPSSLFKKSDFAGVKTVIAAVSGGSDSLSLMLLLKDYLSREPVPVKLVAITVDHRLRPESAAEALWVSQLCQQIGIEHKTISWRDAKPLSAVSFNARLARYNLLLSEAENYDNALIMTGHTLDDQAETYYMRLKRGSKRGLAAMPRQSLLMGKIKLIRPLLKQRRAALRSYLQSLHQPWLDDPSNVNPAYERVRIRLQMDDDTILEAQKAIEVAAKARRKQARETAALLAVLKPQRINDVIIFHELATDVMRHPQFAFLLGVLAAIQGGALYLPNDARIKALAGFSTRLITTLQRTTLSGAVIERTANALRIWRENRDIPQNDIGPNRTVIWDGRFRIRNHGAETIHAQGASLAELKSVIAANSLTDKTFHFTSLQSSLVLRNHLGIDIPVVTKRLAYCKNVTVESFMNPFGWLVSGDDFALYNAVKPIFTVNYQ